MRVDEKREEPPERNALVEEEQKGTESHQRGTP